MKPRVIGESLKFTLVSIRTRIDSLTAILNDPNIVDVTYFELTQKMLFKAKEEYVLAINRAPISQETGKRGDKTTYSTYYTRINGKKNKTKRSKYEDLINYLYDYYTSEESTRSLSTIYTEAKIWKSQQPGIVAKSLRTYEIDWKKYVFPHQIYQKHLNCLTANDFENFFEEIIDKYRLNFTQVKNIRTSISYVVKYCVKRKYMQHNFLNDIDLNSFDYYGTKKRSNKNSKEAFPPHLIPRINELCHEKMENPKREKKYLLALMLNIEIGDRFGEISALDWCNIDLSEGTITTRDENIETYTVKDNGDFQYNGRQKVGHVKSNIKPVPVAISHEAVKLLKEIKKLFPDSETVFPNFRYNTFNNLVKEIAKDLNLNPELYGTHSLRSTAATRVYNDTGNIRIAQAMLHHSSSQTTEKYISDLANNKMLQKYFDDRNRKDIIQVQEQSESRTNADQNMQDKKKPEIP